MGGVTVEREFKGKRSEKRPEEKEGGLGRRVKSFGEGVVSWEKVKSLRSGWLPGGGGRTIESWNVYLSTPRGDRGNLKSRP